MNQMCIIGDIWSDETTDSSFSQLHRASSFFGFSSPTLWFTLSVLMTIVSRCRRQIKEKKKEALINLYINIGLASNGRQSRVATGWLTQCKRRYLPQDFVESKTNENKNPTNMEVTFIRLTQTQFQKGANATSYMLENGGKWAQGFRKGRLLLKKNK